MVSKIYWSKINTFLSKRKMPNKPPQLVNSNFLSDFPENEII